MEHWQFFLEAYRHGRLIHSDTFYNEQTDGGLQFLYDRFFNQTTRIPYELGVGSSNTPASPTDTDLTDGVWKAFNAANITTQGKTRVIQVTFGTAEANISINELGLRTNGSPPILLARNTTTEFNKTTTDTIHVGSIIDMSEVVVPL